jgi:putative ABC transport system permease protein
MSTRGWDMLGSLREWWARIRAYVRTSDLDRDFEEELQSHVAMLTEDHVDRGMTPEQARRAALVRVGGAASLHQRHREARALPAVDTLLHDLRFASRLLIRDRWSTAAVVVALALGMGVNTTVFTVINGWNLRDLPVDEPGRLMHLGTRDAQGRQRGVSYLDFLDWQTGLRAFSGLAAYADTSMNLAAGGLEGLEGHPAAHLAGCFVSANAFSALRERPIVGRDFRPEDDRPGAAPVIIIGHRVWIERFGGDTSAIGRAVRLNGAPATIIGVMPPGFMFPYLAEVWQPIAQMSDLAAQPRDARAIGVFGRLADGVTLARARAELSAFSSALAAQFPATNAGVQGTVVKFTDQFFGNLTDGPPLIMMVAVGFVLLIACANAANLLLARAASRRPEISLRRALGASRGRIVRQLFVESLLLAAFAGVFGLLLAWPLTRAIAAETADFDLPYWARLAFDARVFGFVAAIGVATALVFGLAPAWKLSGAGTAERLGDAARTTSESSRSRRWMSGLLVGEIALSVILLTSAGLLIRSAQALYAADQAIDLPNLVTGRLSLPPGRYGSPQARIAFYEQLELRLASIPSISSAAIGTALPFFGATRRHVALDSDLDPAAAETRWAQTLAIGSRYFETLGLSLQRGRSFDARDGLPGQEAVIVNERFVTAYLPGRDPIGRRIRLIDSGSSSAASAPLTIVGIAPIVRHAPATDARPAVYLPWRGSPAATMQVMMRNRDNTAASLVREELRALDPDVPLYNISTLERLSQQSRWTQRAVSSLLGLFAFIATLLSAMGLYAVTTYSISRRRSEIGLRMALGAQRLQVAWLFLRGTLVHVGLGLTMGVAGALAIGQLLRGLLVQTNPLDPYTFTLVVVLLAVVALVACLAPTWRASALDPAVALRRD